MVLKATLVTGCAGFIGFHVAKRLLKEGTPVIGYDDLNSYYDQNLKRDRISKLKFMSSKSGTFFDLIEAKLEDFEILSQVFKGKNKYHKNIPVPKLVINLAAQAGVRYSIKNPSAYIQSNLVGFSNILELSKLNNIENLLYASSSSVYGGNKKYPFSELDNVNHPVSLYGATKRANELLAHSYSSLFDLPATGLRFFTVYGPWGRPDMALFIFTKSILNNVPIDVFNYGDMTRDFTYIDDIVESIIRLLDKPATKDENFDFLRPNQSSSWAPHRIFNIGNSKPAKLSDYIDALEECLGKKAIKNYLPMQPGDVKSTYSNTELLESWIKFKPNTAIKDGVSNFVNWYKDYYRVN